MRKPFKVFKLQSTLWVKESLRLLYGKWIGRKVRTEVWDDDGTRKQMHLGYIIKSELPDLEIE